MISNSGVEFAGDITVDRIDLYGTIDDATNKLKGIDLKKFIYRIEIIESLFSKFTTAKFFIEDAQDLLNNIPIRGEEVIGIVAYTPGITDSNKRIECSFHVYAISNMVQSGDRANMYVLECISAEAFINTNRKVSRSFTGKVSDIAKDIITSNKYGLAAKKQPVVETTSNDTHYISNYWTPVKNLDFLCGTAVSEDGSASYVFFENRDGLNFVSLERLYGNAPIQTFVKDNLASSSKTEVGDRYKRIIKIDARDSFDYYAKSDEGAFGSHLTNYDLTIKRFTEIDYFTAGDPDKKMVNNSAINSMSTSLEAMNVKYETTTAYALFNDIKDVSNTKIIQKRKSRLANATYHVVDIEVAGRTDYTVGYPVELNIPTTSPISQTSTTNESKDKFMSGVYIIAEVIHSINGGQHQVKMKLIKDSIG